jgi:hypothetical protein
VQQKYERSLLPKGKKDRNRGSAETICDISARKLKILNVSLPKRRHSRLFLVLAGIRSRPAS